MLTERTKIGCQRTVLLLFFCAVVIGYAQANYVHSLTDGILGALLLACVGIFLLGILFLRRHSFLPLREVTINLRVVHVLLIFYLFLTVTSSILLMQSTGAFGFYVFFTAAANSLVIILLYCVMVALWLISGLKILKVLGIRIQDSLGRCIGAIVVGILVTIVYVYACVILGFVGIHMLIGLTLLHLLIGGGFIRQVYLLGGQRITIRWSFGRMTLGQLKTLLVCVILVYSVFAFISVSGGRPFDTDGIKTYAYIPYQIIQTKSSIFFPHTPLNNSVFASTYLYIPIQLLGPNFLNYVNILMLLLVVATIYYISKKLFNEWVAVTSSFLFLSMDLLFQLSLTTKSDLLVMLFALWTCTFLFRSLSTARSRSLVIAGILLGMSVAVKYNVLLLLPAIGLWIVWYVGNSYKEKSAAAGIFLLGVFIGFFPWGLRQYLLFGSPLYPFFIQDVIAAAHSLFEWSRTGSVLYSNFIQELVSYTNVLRLKNSFFQNMYILATNRSQYAYNKFGPLLYGLLPLVFFMKPSQKLKQLLMLIAPTAVIWYFVAISQPWYILFIIPFIWMYLAKSLDAFDWPTGKLIVGVVVALLLVSNIRTHNLQLVTTLFAGNYSPDTIINGYRVERYLRDSLSATDPEYLILPFGKIDSFVIKDHYLHVIDNDFLVYWLPLVDMFREPQALISELQRRGVTHIFYDDAFMYALEYPVCDKTPCPTIEEYGDSFRDIEPYLEVVKPGPTWKLYRVPRSSFIILSTGL